MTVCRYYLMTAKLDHAEQLIEQLVLLASKVKPLDGCQGVELYRDGDNPQVAHFIERWRSVEAHKAAGASLGREAFAPVMAVLADPPQSCYLDPVAL